jgi:hypothetical protein
VRDPDRGLESVDGIDRIVEPAAGRAGTDAASGDGRKSLAGACPADQQEVEYVLTAEQAGAATQVDVTVCALVERSTIDNDLAR